jgi:hypothetical protein
MIRLAILLDMARANEETSSINRLAVALALDGMRTVLGIADSTPAEHATRTLDGPIPRVHLPIRSPFWLRHSAAALASERFEASTGNDPLDAIILSGIGTFDLARRTSEIVECPLIVDVRSRHEADFVAKNDNGTLIAVAATEPLANRLALHIERERVEFIRPCLPAVPKRTAAEGRFIAVLGPLLDPTVWTALLDGILDATNELDSNEQPMIALELGDSRQAVEVWSHARRRGLLDRIVSIDHIDQLRPLLTSAASIIVPESARTLRTIVPQAMHRGVLPIAAEDPDMDYLQDGVSALIVRDGATRRPSAWGEALRASMDEATRAKITRGARASAQPFLASEVAESWATLLHSIVHGDSIQLREA